MCMKFGTLIEQKMLYRMALRSPQSYIAFNVKVKVKMSLINNLEFDLVNDDNGDDLKVIRRSIVCFISDKFHINPKIQNGLFLTF